MNIASIRAELRNINRALGLLNVFGNELLIHAMWARRQYLDLLD